MDLRPRERPINSIRDFLVQIFTITCGIVIALWFDSIVTGRREARLAAETRADFSAEIAENRAKVELVRGMAPGEEKWMGDLLEWGAAHLAHPDAKPPPAIQNRAFVALNSAAWETAVATQATRLLSFAETRALAHAYNSQAALNAMSAQAREQWITIAGYGDVEHLNDAETREALRNLRVALAYTYSLAALDDRVIGDYKAAQQEIDKAR
jgi:hypothetical protein